MMCFSTNPVINKEVIITIYLLLFPVHLRVLLYIYIYFFFFLAQLSNTEGHRPGFFLNN